MHLNSEQSQAVTSQSQHNMVLAGAGTGKTRTIIHRVVYLIEKGILPQKIAVLTFTRRATNELVYRLSNQLPENTNSIFVGTFHQFCILNIRKYKTFFAAHQYRIIDKEEQLQIIRDLRQLEDCDLALKNSELLQLISYAKNSVITIQSYLDKFKYFDLETRKTIISLDADYQKQKIQMQYLDFDDILYIFSRHLKNETSLKASIFKNYEYFLVDEMQDTNPVQWSILESLSAEASLFCVGDDAQSIYMFRGADFRNVQHFNKKIVAAQNLKLKENFRSTQEILDLANWLLAESELSYNKKLVAHRGAGIKPQIHTFEKEWDEARWVVDKIKHNYQKYNSWSKQMVLVRTAWTARMLESVLVDNKIPYVFIGGIDLMSSAHVRDVISLIQSSVSSSDSLAWRRYLCLWPKIGKKTADKIYAQISLLQNTKEVVDFLKLKFPQNTQIANSILAVSENLTNVVDCIKTATSQLEQLLGWKYDNWEWRKKDLLLLQKSQKHLSLQSFLETYALNPIYADQTDQSTDKLSVITVHSAKGLEASICYLFKAQANMYPHSRSIGDAEKEEEERRVLYVAMTRAKDKLYITRSLSDSQNLLNYQAENKYFLKNIPSNLVESYLHKALHNYRKDICE